MNSKQDCCPAEYLISTQIYNISIALSALLTTDDLFCHYVHVLALRDAGSYTIHGHVQRLSKINEYNTQSSIR